MSPREQLSKNISLWQFLMALVVTVVGAAITIGARDAGYELRIQAVEARSRENSERFEVISELRAELAEIRADVRWLRAALESSREP